MYASNWRQQLRTATARLKISSNHQYVLLVGITLLAFALRFYKLGEWSFWIDEVLTVSDVERVLNGPTSRLAITESLIGAALHLFGTREWSARLIPAVIGVISVPVLYFFIRRMFGAHVATISVLLLAISPWHLYWSQNARFYTLLMLLYSVGLFLFFLAVEEGSYWRLLLSLLLLFLSVHVRLTALFFAPVIGSHLVAARTLSLGKAPKLGTGLFAAILLATVAFAVYDVFGAPILGRGSFISSSWVSLSQEFFGMANHSPLRLAQAMAYRIGIPVLCLGSCGVVYVLRERKRDGLFVSMGALVPPVLLLVIAPFMFTVDRYIFVVLPFWSVLSAVAISEAYAHSGEHGRLLSVTVLLLLVATSLGQDLLYFRYQNADRPDWRGAFRIVSQEWIDGDVVVATRPELGHYYFGETVRDIQSMDLDDAATSDDRIWFVIDQATSVVEPVLLQWIRRNSDLVDALEVCLPGKSLGIRIYLYDPKG